MKYNQNHKIKQITESTLVIGVDIAKENHVARAQDARGIEFGKPMNIENSRAGFQRFRLWMKSLMREHDKPDVIVGFEPTGHYWMAFAQFLRHEGIKYVVVNPMHVKKSKELDDNSPTKNDVKDARVIAQLVKDGRYSEPQVPTGIYAELRNGMNLRDRLQEDLQRVRGRILNWLDRFFPEFHEVFKIWEGKAALMTLEAFPLPQEIINLGAEKILRHWKQEVKRAIGIKRANALVAAAKRSVGLTKGLSMARQELQSLMEQYQCLCGQMEQLMQDVEALLEQIPAVPYMMSIPGVGLVTVAGFLAEVGDLSNYTHPRQVQKLAGFNLRENTSGKFRGQTSITKRGRPKLRSLLYAAIRPMVAKNREFKQMHEYLTTRSENPLKKQQSMIALCCKLIRVLFSLGHKRVSYNGEKCLGHIRLQQIQNAA
ncbi:IS110 family transposase [Ornithinibacillus sp. FSL M8-0202]|uniref:IS110 family transposase n=1 Tax=Ornithinibacillus sp. FSL M8-0202 TaxID=2921616 RepID=UPI0030CF37F3